MIRRTVIRPYDRLPALAHTAVLALVVALAIALAVLPAGPVAGPLAGPRDLAAQTIPDDDPVIRAMWTEGMEEGSRIYDLAQALLDSIGPRLTGAPQYDRAVDWLMERYREWGIQARREQIGTWLGWERGITHVDLVEPWVRTLEGTMLAWSPGTDGPVEGPVVLIGEAADSASFEAWLPEARGKFIAVSVPEPTCRPRESWEEWATEESWQRMQEERQLARRAFYMARRGILPRGRSRTGIARWALRRLEDVGALAILTSRWSGGWGVNKVFSARTEEIPTLDLSCEDYGLVARLAEREQGPVMRLEAEARFLGEVPNYNVIAEIPGTELPDEYVVLSAHLDSWDGATGATDNGTGTLTMLEAMRILKAADPNPRRTIVVGHWASEEQGLNGSGAFAIDHPEVVDGLQAAFNQDNGTWRIEYIRMQGFMGAGEHFGRWFSRLPAELKEPIELDIPGVPERGGSDHMSFICRGAPGFRLQSSYPGYRQYTWHTNRDTFDKIVFDDLRNNATLAAMLAYLASEDPERVPRDRRLMPVDPRTGERESWPGCGTPRRSWEEYRR